MIDILIELPNNQSVRTSVAVVPSVNSHVELQGKIFPVRRVLHKIQENQIVVTLAPSTRYD